FPVKCPARASVLGYVLRKIYGRSGDGEVMVVGRIVLGEEEVKVGNVKSLHRRVVIRVGARLGQEHFFVTTPILLVVRNLPARKSPHEFIVLPPGFAGRL